MTRRIWRLALLIGCWVLGTRCWGDALPTPEVSTLANGARLVTLYEPDSPLVSIDVFFCVGADDEGGQAGITGLITRAWFADSRWRTAAQLQRDLGAAGGGVGSLYGGDYAEIWSVCGSSDSEVKQSAQVLLLNLIAAPGLGTAAVDSAKQGQLRLLALERDNPLEAVLDRLRGRLWSAAPQGRPLLGTPDSITPLSAQDLSEYYARYFRPRRAVFVIAGNIRPERARRLVEENLNAAGWSEESRASAPMLRPAVDQVPPGLRDIALSRPAPSGVLALGFLAPGTERNAADWPALLLLDAVLGGGKSSRLFRLRDTGALPGTYEIRTLLAPSRIQSLWAVYGIGNGAPTETRATLAREIAALGKGEKPVTDAELARAKAYLKGQHAIDRQRLKDRSYGVGWAEAMGLGARFDTDFESRVDAVTTDQINQLARQVLGANAAAVYTQ